MPLLKVFWREREREREREWTVSRTIKIERARERGRKTRKGESNDSPGIPDRREASDTPGVPPVGGCEAGAEKA